MKPRLWFGFAAVTGLFFCAACFLLQADDKKDDKKDEKVIKKDSGLKYVEIKEGDGKEAKKGDVVEVHYTGWLEDGTKFDCSVDRKKPFTFNLGEGQVIKGWDEGVAGMKEGGKRKLIIPYQLAYGEQGRPPTIPAKAQLTFEVQLLKVK
jgi:FKBP-type peptidyl-prolyl cis-trans isomerase